MRLFYFEVIFILLTIKAKIPILFERAEHDLGAIQITIYDL